MNCQFRGRSYPTDVLSFHYKGEREEGIPLLGEIAISPEVAASNARRWCTSADREARKLLVHGILHLLGYDHETDSGQMNRLQGRLVRRRTFQRCAPIMARG